MGEAAQVKCVEEGERKTSERDTKVDEHNTKQTTLALVLAVCPSGSGEGKPKAH